MTAPGDSPWGSWRRRKPNVYEVLRDGVVAGRIAVAPGRKHSDLEWGARRWRLVPLFAFFDVRLDLVDADGGVVARYHRRLGRKGRITMFSGESGTVALDVWTGAIVAQWDLGGVLAVAAAKVGGGEAPIHASRTVAPEVVLFLCALWGRAARHSSPLGLFLGGRIH